jgi:hypothetical protein
MRKRQHTTSHCQPALHSDAQQADLPQTLANVLFRHYHQRVGAADVQALRPADLERLPA